MKLKTCFTACSFILRATRESIRDERMEILPDAPAMPPGLRKISHAG
jgi:hypothetical protein